MDMRRPPGGPARLAHGLPGRTRPPKSLADGVKISMLRQLSRGRRCAHARLPPIQTKGFFVKVIASSLRKGNIVDIDGKLYVVLSSENIHPGKGTPVTQADMRRIS